MEITYRNILYATDLSENAAQAFRHAIALAKCHNAKIHILHMMAEMESSVVNYVATVIGEERFADLEIEHEGELRELIRQRLDRFAADELNNRSEDLKRVASINVHHGNPVVGILEHADQLSADLIVMGSHGKGPLHYAFLGSVAEKVLRKSDRPILVIPLPKD